MKILSIRGQEYPSKYEWGKEEHWNNTLKKMMEARLVKNYPKIEMVIVGDSCNPYTEIYLEDGTMLYDENSSPWWSVDENDKVLANKSW